MKVVHKFATGDKIPEGAKYLTTVVEEPYTVHNMNTGGGTCYGRTVWHYFLVDAPDATP